MRAGGCIPRTPICVDSWCDHSSTDSRIFLLSHAHGDHIVGLNRDWCHPIYSSHFTSDFIKRTVGIQQEFLRPLDLNTPHVIPLDGDIGNETMTLTLLDANHCPGSVMFVMEGYFGVIIHTGDFRFDEVFKTTESFDLLKQYASKVDILYLDNTYCDPSCVFPSRQKCQDEIVALILKYPDDHFVLAARNLGKEKLFSDIAIRTKELISVSTPIYANMEMLNLQNNFDANDSTCRIRTAPFYTVNEKNVRKWNCNQQTQAIVPSALFSGHLDFHKRTSFYERLHMIPYSDHSSFPELCEFVELIRPKRVIPIIGVKGVSTSGNRSDVSCFNKYLNGEQQILFTIPESVRLYMNRGRIKDCSREIKIRKSFSAPSGKRRKVQGVVYVDDDDGDD